MNTERLLTIVNVLDDEVNSQGLPAALDGLTTSLKNAIDSPNESNQRVVESNLALLTSLLAGAPSNLFSTGMRQDLESLSINGVSVATLVGDRLAAELNKALEKGYGSVQTLDRLRALQKHIGTLSSAINQLKQGLIGVGISEELLGDHQSIVGLTMPRNEVDSAVELEKEIHFLRRLLGDLSEVADGNRTEPTVHSIHSSDFGVSLFSSLQVAALCSSIIGGIKTVLESLKKHRDLRKQAEAIGVDEETASLLTKKGRENADKELDRIVAEAFQECKLDSAGRVNEIRTSIRFEVNGIANRLEKGFDFDIRTTVPKDSNPDLTSKVNSVIAYSAIHFERLQGPQLLCLPEPDDANGTNVNSERSPALARKPRNPKVKKEKT